MKLEVIKKNVALLSVAFVLALMTVMGLQANAQSAGGTVLSPEDAELVKKAQDDVQNNLHLGGIHSRMGLTCATCHGSESQLPNDTASVENKACMSCHGNYETLSAKATQSPINVHGSHLGPEIECTACHQGHEPSKAYCTNCHTNFDLPMPGGEK